MRRRQEEQSDLPAPGGRSERDHQDSAEHHAARPAGVQHVEMMRLASRIQRGGDRIDHGLDGAVGERENQRADVELLKAVRGHGNDRGDDVPAKGKGHAAAVTDPIDDQAEEHDAEREWKESRPLDGADLSLSQVEVGGPLGYQEPTHDESECRRNQRDDTRDEQSRVSLVMPARSAHSSLLLRVRATAHRARVPGRILRR
jgi:hypothetical protein